MRPTFKAFDQGSDWPGESGEKAWSGDFVEILDFCVLLGPKFLTNFGPGDYFLILLSVFFKFVSYNY